MPAFIGVEWCGRSPAGSLRKRWMRPWGSVWARIRPIAQEIDSFVRSQMGTTAILHTEGRRGSRPRTCIDIGLATSRYAALTRPALTVDHIQRQRFIVPTEPRPPPVPLLEQSTSKRIIGIGRRDAHLKLPSDGCRSGAGRRPIRIQGVRRPSVGG